MTLIACSSSDVFYGWCRKNLPQFVYDSFTTSEGLRNDDMFGAWEALWNHQYSLLGDLINELDVDTASPEFLYHLGLQMGIEDIANLANYVDADGNYINSDGVIQTQDWYDALVTSQRTYIKFCLFRYLLKGTPQSIVTRFYEYGYPVEVIEKWFSESPGPSASFVWPNNVNDIAIPKELREYGTPIWDDPTGYIFDQQQVPYDIRAEIVADIPSAAFYDDMGEPITTYPDGTYISWINQLVDSNYGYRYLTTQGNTLFFKTGDDPSSGYAPYTWYESSNRFGVTKDGERGTLQRIEALDSRLFIRTASPALFSVIDRKMETYQDVDPTPYFSVDDGNVSNFIIFDDGKKLLLDRPSLTESPSGNKFDIRDIEMISGVASYQLLPAETYNKPVGFGRITDIQYIGATTEAVKGKYYFLTTEDNQGMCILIKSDYVTIVSDVVDLPVRYQATNWNIYSSGEFQLTIIECALTDAYYTRAHFISFTGIGFLNISISSDNVGTVSPHRKRIRIGDIVLIAPYENTFQIWDLPRRKLIEGNTSNNLVILDMWMGTKLYIQGFPGFNEGIPNEDTLYKIQGFNLQTASELYKSHHIDLKTQILSTSIDTTSLADIKAWMEDNIVWLKPAHVVLDDVSFTLEGNSLFDDSVTMGDSTSGTEYVMSMYAHYDGIHPYKSDTDPHTIYNDNTGVSGAPRLTYSINTFTFMGETSASEFDDLVFHNTPL